MHVTFDSLKTFYNILVQKLKNHRGNWNQNDPAADDYIKNRPFYSEGVKEITIIDTIVNFDNSSSNMESSGPIVYNTMIDDHSAKSFKIGETYTVIWDGQTYECIAQDADGVGAIGNASLIGYMKSGYEDTGEPFLIGAEQGYRYIVLSTEDGNHTLIVKTITEVIKKLDKKFIDMPDDIVTDEELNETLNFVYNDIYWNINDLNNQVVKTVSQSLTPTKQSQARANIGAASNDEVVKIISQTLTDTQKAQARNNIGAGTSNFSGNYADLTNIPETPQANWEMYNPNSNAYITNKPFGYEYELEDAMDPVNIAELSSGTLDTDSGLYFKQFQVRNYAGVNVINPNAGTNLYYFSVNGKPNIAKCYLFKPSRVSTQDYPGIGNATLHSLYSKTAVPMTVYLDGSQWLDVTDTGEDWFLLHDGIFWKFYTTRPDLKITDVYRILSETINQLDEKFIPDTIARVDNIPQSDWNQNDETAADFIKNKPDILTSDILSEKMNATDPVGSGTFSMGRMGGTTIGAASFTHGGGAEASGFHSYAKGLYPVAKGEYSHAEGYRVEATGDYSYAFGDEAIASGKYAYSFGEDTEASSNYSHAEGYHSIATTDKNESVTIAAYGLYSSDFQCAHAEGYGTVACGIGSHTEGLSTKASGEGAHAEGRQTVSSGTSSHAEGYNTTSSGIGSHSEGQRTSASGGNSHAEGLYTTASGTNSHAEGYYTTASGDNSHAEGEYSEAAGKNQHVEGKYNALDENNKFVHIIGNGTYSTRSNAHTVDWNGNAWYSGDVYVGSTSGTNKDEGSKKLATEEYVDTSIANLSDFSPDEILNTLNELNAAIANKITVPQNAVAGDLLIYDGTNWVCISKADLIAEIIAALPNAEEATF